MHLTQDIVFLSKKNSLLLSRVHGGSKRHKYPLFQTSHSALCIIDKSAGSHTCNAVSSHHKMVKHIDAEGGKILHYLPCKYDIVPGGL